MRGSKERRPNTGVHHTAPPVNWLLPEPKVPGELTILDHLFVATPGGVNHHIKNMAGLSDLLEQSLRVAI